MKVNVISVEQVVNVPGISLELTVREAETILAALGICNSAEEGGEVSRIHSGLQIATAQAAGEKDYRRYYGELEAYIHRDYDCVTIRKRKC